MRVGFAVISFVTALVLLGCSASPPAQTPTRPVEAAPADTAFDPAWARDLLWDDGLAEVALYDARRPQYGKIESYEAVFIVVKEDFDASLQVKADPPFEGKQLLPVLKLNAVHSYWTDRYPYNYLQSVFVRRDDPSTLVKLTLGSQEWCGNTFKEVSTRGDRPELHFHSYFDRQGDSTRPLDLRPGDLLEDQLPLALRGLKFQAGLRVQRRVLPSLISNGLHAPVEFQLATLIVVGEEPLRTPAGNFSAWKLTLEMGEVKQTWWFDSKAPHILLKMESSDGRAWLLKEWTRTPYWQVPTYRPQT